MPLQPTPTQHVLSPQQGFKIGHGALAVGVGCILSVGCLFLFTTAVERAHLGTALTQQSKWGFLLTTLIATGITLLWLLYLAISAFLRMLITRAAHGARLSQSTAQKLAAITMCAGTIVLLYAALLLVTAILWISPANEEYYVSGLFTSIFTAVVSLALLIFVFPALWLLMTLSIETRRHRSTRALFIHAAGLASAGMNPSHALLQAVQPSHGSHKKQQDFNQAIRESRSFSDALALALPDMKPRDKALLAAAEHMGILTPLLIQKSEEIQQQEQNEPQQQIMLLFILEWLVIILISLHAAIVIYPRFFWYFGDFGSRLPGVTRAAFHTMRWFLGIMPEQGLPGAFYLLVPVFVAYLVGWYLRKAHHSLDAWAVNANIPLVADALLKPGLVDTCFFLAHALRAGAALPQAVSGACMLDINPVLKTRLRAWEAGLHAGHDPAQAAISAGLPTVMTAFIKAASHGPALAEGFDRLARYYRDQATRTRLVLQSLLLPTLTLITGIFAGVVIIGVFLGVNVLIVLF